MKTTKKQITEMTTTKRGENLYEYSFRCDVGGVLFERPMGFLVTYVTTFNPETGEPVVKELKGTENKSAFINALFDYFKGF